MKDEELIWVDKEFALKYNVLKEDKTKREEQIKMFNEYMENIQLKARQEFKVQFESLEEDAAIYKGLMLNVKQAFEAAKNEQLKASYDLWDQFDKEIPNIEEKTQKIIDVLTPLVKQLTQVNDLLGKISTYQFEKVINTVQTMTNLYGESKDMVEFLVNNYKPNTGEVKE